MSYCDDCLHKEVCGDELCEDEAMISCADKFTLDEIESGVKEVEIAIVHLRNLVRKAKGVLK